MVIRKASKQTRRILEFGFDPEESPYHFSVTISRNKMPIIIEECFVWNTAIADKGNGQPVRAPILKATLERERWGPVSAAARAEFNRRLRLKGFQSASWKNGSNLLEPHFGKELTLLAWAVENAENNALPNMIANWLGLEPEERWWLYTTVNATFGHPEHGPDRGWRKAIKIAFAENPALIPSSSRLPPDDPDRIGLLTRVSHSNHRSKETKAIRQTVRKE